MVQQKTKEKKNTVVAVVHKKKWVLFMQVLLKNLKSTLDYNKKWYNLNIEIKVFGRIMPRNGDINRPTRSSNLTALNYFL